MKYLLCKLGLMNMPVAKYFHAIFNIGNCIIGGAYLIILGAWWLKNVWPILFSFESYLFCLTIVQEMNAALYHIG
jgi:hypothetical protein